MLNETLCNEDRLQQANLAQVDFFMKRLLSFHRIPVEVYEKLIDLREEEEEIERQSKSKQKKDEEIEEQNFFLQNDENDPTANEGEGYDELESNEIVNDDLRIEISSFNYETQLQR